MVVMYLEMLYKNKEHPKNTVMRNIRKWREFMRRLGKTMRIVVHPEVCIFLSGFVHCYSETNLNKEDH